MTACGVLPRLYDALSSVCGSWVSGVEGAGGSCVKLPLSWVVTWLSDTDPESDEPPQAVRSVDKKQIQTIAIGACIERFHAKTEALKRGLNFEERCFILDYAVNFGK